MIHHDTTVNTTYNRIPYVSYRNPPQIVSETPPLPVTVIPKVRNLSWRPPVSLTVP